MSTAICNKLTSSPTLGVKTKKLLNVKRISRLCGRTAAPSNPDKCEQVSPYHYDCVRKLMVAKLSTSLETLEQLASDPNPDVRSAVATNPRTPNFILSMLARDSDNSVRMAIAASTNSNIELIRQLSLDQEQAIATRARHTFKILEAQLRAKESKIFPNFASRSSLPRTA